MKRDYIHCTNLEKCPKCDEYPSRVTTFARLRSLECNCGNNYGSVTQPYDGRMKNATAKLLYQQWQDGVRKEINKRKLTCNFVEFETEDEIMEYLSKN